MTVQPMPRAELLNLPAGPAPRTDTATGSIELLVRQIIEQTAEAPLPHLPLEEPDPEILLDLEVDGVRCLLLRQPPPPDLAPPDLAPPDLAPPEHAVTLSPRELEIARMIAKGYPNKTIAAVLEISAWTVCTHIRRIFAKLGVGSRAAMVARLSEDGALNERSGTPRANGTHT